MIQLVCFSRQRPLQLHGFLRSVVRHWKGEYTLRVLAKVDPDYETAYLDLAREFLGSVEVRPETDFFSDLAYLVGDAEFTCFGCDDVVYVAPVDTRYIGVGLRTFPEVIGWSLRLGSNITRDMFGYPMPQPAFRGEGIEWDVHEGGVDWRYPWEVLGTVYRTEFVKTMLDNMRPASPSQLEARGARSWAEYTMQQRMVAYGTSRLVVPTVNVVQSEYPNGIVGDARYTPDYLLEQWHEGWRLDVGAYDGMAPESWRIGDLHLQRVAA